MNIEVINTYEEESDETASGENASFDSGLYIE